MTWLLLILGAGACGPAEAVFPPSSLVWVGDSITAAGTSVNSVASTLSSTTFLGTQTTGTTLHEGVSGWSWARFAGEDPDVDAADSPFMTGDDTFDISGYFTTIGATPRMMIWALGTNDILRYEDGDEASQIEATLGYADLLLDAIDAVFPTMRHLIVLPYIGNDNTATFASTYPAPFNSVEHYREVRTLFNNMARSHFNSRGGTVIEPLLDGTDDYPAANAVHPDASGHAVIAAAIVAAVGG